MPKLAEAYVDITARDMKLKKALAVAHGEVNSAAAKMERRFTQFGAHVGRVMLDMGKKIALGMAAVGIAGTTAALKLAADWEQSELAFETMLGSAKKAKAFMAELEQFANKTPFELPGLIDASRRLLAFGFAAGDVLPIMTRLGDAVSGLGGGAYEIDRVTRALGQMKAKGKVSAEEMLQLAELGIPAWEMLAKKIGTDIPTAMKMAERGQISAATGINGVLEGMNERFGGLMEKQSKTMAGRWSTLKDSMASILRKIGLDINRTFHVTGGMARLSQWFDDNRETIRSWAKTAMERMRDFGKYIIDNIPKAIEVLLRLPQAWDKVAAGFKIGLAFIGGMITDLILLVQQLFAVLNRNMDSIRRLRGERIQNAAVTRAAVKDAKAVLAQGWAKVDMPTMPAMPGLPAATGGGKGEKTEPWAAIPETQPGFGLAATVQAAQDALQKRQEAIQKELETRKSAWDKYLEMAESASVRLTAITEGETAARLKQIDIEASHRRKTILDSITDETRRAALLKALDADVADQKATIAAEDAKAKADAAKAEADRKRSAIGFLGGGLSEVWRGAMTAGARLAVPEAPAVTESNRLSQAQLDELKTISGLLGRQIDEAKGSINKLSGAMAAT